MNLEEFIKGLDPERQEKARRCLPDEALEAIAGGEEHDPRNCRPDPPKCPHCGSSNTETKCVETAPGAFTYYFHCHDCGYEWSP